MFLSTLDLVLLSDPRQQGCMTDLSRDVCSNPATQQHHDSQDWEQAWPLLQSGSALSETDPLQQLPSDRPS